MLHINKQIIYWIVVVVLVIALPIATPLPILFPQITFITPSPPPLTPPTTTTHPHPPSPLTSTTPSPSPSPPPRTLPTPLTATPSPAARLPGFKTTLSEKGLTYLKDVSMVHLEDYLCAINVPPKIGAMNTPIGGFEYNLSRIAVSPVQIERSAISLLPRSSAAHLTIVSSTSATLNWMFKQSNFPHLTDHGTAHISISNTSVNVSVFFGASDGRPYAAVLSTDMYFGEIDVKLHSPSSWLYNLYVDDFASEFVPHMVDTLASTIRDAVNEGANNALSSLPITERINAELEIDYRLLENPIFSSDYITLPHKGEIYSIAHHDIGVPFVSYPLPDSRTTDMLQMFIGDYVANTLAYAFYVDKQLRVLITDDVLPPTVPFRLNTTYFQDFVPPLYKAYPDMMMALDLYAIQHPLITFDNTGAYLRGKGSMDVYVLPVNVHAFSLSVDVFCAGSAGLKGMNITGNLRLLNVSLALQYTQIGEFEVSDLQSLVNALFTYVVLPMSNKFLDSGFELPTIQGLSFINRQVGWGPHYIYVSSDIVYDPTILPKKSVVKM